MKNVFILVSLLILSACDNTPPTPPVKQPTPVVIETPEPPAKVEEPAKVEKPAPAPKKKKAEKRKKYKGEQPVATTPGALRKPLEK